MIKKEVVKICPRCGKEFNVFRFIYKTKGEYIPKKEKTFCSYKCSNVRTLTKEHREKISKALLGGNTGSQKEKKFYINACSYCGKKIKGTYTNDKDHCCSREHRIIFDNNKKLKIAKKEGFGSITVSIKSVRNLLFFERGKKCEICGTETWNGKPVPVVMDHIDGDSDNWSYKNLRIICRNCDGQLDTFAGKNIGKNKNQTIRMKQQKERVQNGIQKFRKVS